MTGYCDVFDVITCNDVIEHVTDPGIAIKHVASMLRNGGIAYFEIPNRDDVSAVIADGHYQLFGITQLEHDLAAQYYGAHAPGVRYGVEHYLRLPEYRALFDQAGLSLELHRDAATTRSVDEIRGSLRDLRSALPEKLSTVPMQVRSDVEAVVTRYLDEAQRLSSSSDQERLAYVDRYGIGFWRIVARKRAPAR